MKTLALRAGRLGFPLLLALANAGCSDAADDTEQQQRDVIESYSTLVASSYEKALKAAKSLDTAVGAFLDEPTDERFQEAKEAWLASRNPYSVTEAFRFYEGPIDNGDDGPEPLINSWPLDEVFIDYTVDAKDEVDDTGIINAPEQYPVIDADVLSSLNASEGETAITTGYHAIEFLLWGQDLSDDGPGDRPYTDYVLGDGATAKNQDRRRDYLRAISGLLVQDLSQVNAAWVEGEDNYRKYFTSLPPREALGKILRGMGSLSGAELSKERMSVALVNKDQEDEHSCFSDNTLEDLEHNAQSIQNVLLGTNGDVSGAAIVDLIAAKDAATAQSLEEQIQLVIDELVAVKKTGARFDQVITTDDYPEAREHLLTAVRTLGTFTDDLEKGAKAIGVEFERDE